MVRTRAATAKGTAIATKTALSAKLVVPAVPGSGRPSRVARRRSAVSATTYVPSAYMTRPEMNKVETQATMGTEKAVAAKRSSPTIDLDQPDKPNEFLAYMDLGKRMRRPV